MKISLTIISMQKALIRAEGNADFGEFLLSFCDEIVRPMKRAREIPIHFCARWSLFRVTKCIFKKVVFPFSKIIAQDKSLKQRRSDEIQFYPHLFNFKNKTCRISRIGSHCWMESLARTRPLAVCRQIWRAATSLFWLSAANSTWPCTGLPQDMTS